MADSDDSKKLPGIKPEPRPGYKITVWAGIIGAVVGCSAWMLTMAALGGDWMAFGLTLALDVFLVFVFGKLSLRHPLQRFPLLAGLIVLVTGHCLAMYWWRFELWRSSSAVTHEQLVREKEIVTITICSMIGIILAQFLIFHWFQRNSRKNRERNRR